MAAGARLIGPAFFLVLSAALVGPLPGCAGLAWRAAPPVGAPAATRSISGRVTSSEGGKPVAGARVDVQFAGGPASATTGADGSYGVRDLPFVILRVEISRPGFVSEMKLLPGDEPGPFSLDATLQPAADVSGDVVDETPGSDGQDIVINVLQTRVVAQADARGHFELRNVPLGEQTLRFSKEGYLDQFQVTDIRAGAGGEPIRKSYHVSFEKGFQGTLTLPPDAEGSIVTSVKGQPIVGASIVAREISSGAVRATATSDSDGHYALPGLHPFEKIAIEATHPDHEAETLHFYVVPRGEDHLGIYMRALRWGKLAGHVIDAETGEPLVAHVEAPGSTIITGTDANGYFEMDAPEGTYDLEVDVSSRYEWKHVTGIVVRENEKTDVAVKMEHAAPKDVPASH